MKLTRAKDPHDRSLKSVDNVLRSGDPSLKIV